jgi:hypothetical protein
MKAETIRAYRMNCFTAKIVGAVQLVLVCSLRSSALYEGECVMNTNRSSNRTITELHDSSCF